MPGAVNVAIRWTRPGAGSAPVITSPAFLVAGTVDTVYPTTTFTATGTAPITWSVTAGTLPTGMTFSSGGVLSGTPTATSSGSITFRAANAYGFDDRALTLTVSASGSAVLIQPSDFTYLGYYDTQLNGLDSPYVLGLAVRRVGSEVRLISQRFNDKIVVEYSLAGKTPATTGSTAANQITSTTRTWSCSIPVGGEIPFMYWDDAGSRLFYIYAVNYPDDTQEVNTRIYTATLTDGVGATNIKRLSLDGVPDRRAGTGVVSVPSTFQATYGVGPFAAGLGANFSRMDLRGQVAMGLSLYGIPDPASYPDGTSLTTAQYKVLAARGATPYGRSLELPTNEYTPGQWQSPGPDGLGYWVWGNRYIGGFFIDTPTKKGLVTIGSFGTGRNWYETSTIHYSGLITEAHIYDPADLGRISQGTQSPVLDPIAANMKSLSETRQVNGGAGIWNSSAAYDDVGKVLYIQMNGCGPTGYWNRIYAYSVNV